MSNLLFLFYSANGVRRIKNKEREEVAQFFVKIIIHFKKKLWKCVFLIECSFAYNGNNSTPMAETKRHGGIVAYTENALWTVFVYINKNSLKNCLQLTESIR